MRSCILQQLLWQLERVYENGVIDVFTTIEFCATILEYSIDVREVVRECKTRRNVRIGFNKEDYIEIKVTGFIGEEKVSKPSYKEAMKVLGHLCGEEENKVWVSMPA